MCPPQVVIRPKNKIYIYIISSFTFVHFMLVKGLGHNVVVAFLTKYTSMNDKIQVISLPMFPDIIIIFEIIAKRAIIIQVGI